MAKDMQYYMAQLRRIEEHREKAAEKEIRKIYKTMLKDVQHFIADEYVKLAEDGKLTYEILRSKTDYARFLAEVEQRVSDISPKVSQEIRAAVEEMYKLGYDGMVDAVMKSTTSDELREALQGLTGATPETIRAAVNNPVAGLTLADTLEKNRREIIYDIKRQIGIGLTVGDRMSTMARRIATSLDGDYKKAVRIVRTETHRVREAGHLDSCLEIEDKLEQGTSGMRMHKVWMTMGDERVRPNKRYKTKKGWRTSKNKSGPNHEKMDGQAVPVKEKFDLGGGVKAMAPGQSGVAGHDINCRCTVDYDLREIKKTPIGSVEELSADELEVVKNYTGIYGNEINDYLYGKTNTISDFAEETLNNLHDILDKSALGKAGTYFRGGSSALFGSDAAAILANPQLAVGREFVNKGFLSTSKTQKAAEMFYDLEDDKKVMLVIAASENAKGLDISDISTLAHENETLFVDHSVLKVEKVVDMGWKIVFKCVLKDM